MDEAYDFQSDANRNSRVGENEVSVPEIEVIESDLVGSEPTHKKKKQTNVPIQGRRLSLVWRHYNWVTDDVQQVYAQCKYCEIRYKGNSVLGTSTAKRHTGKCEMYKKFCADNPPKESKFDQKIYVRLWAEAILMHSYTLTIVEHVGLRRLHKYLERKVKSISRNTVLKYCIEEHDKFKSLLHDILANIPGKVCFTCDCWEACNSRGYLTLTAHYVDNDWKLKSRILNFRYFPPPHNGVEIYNFVIGLLKEWGLEKKVFTMTIDNAAPMNVMMSLLESDLHSSSNLPCNGKFFHVRCSAHILNLIIQAGLKVVDGCVIKLRDTAKYIRWSDSRQCRFDECNIATGSEFKGRLSLDMPIRWNSTYNMLERAIEAKKALQLFATRESGFQYALTHEEWIIAEYIHHFLKPFFSITTLFSGSEYPTANLYFGNIIAIESLLVEAHKHAILCIQQMAKNMMSKFEKYWSEYSVILSIAVVLDPRYKLKFVESLYSHLYGAGVNAKVKVVYDAFVELYSSYASTAPANSISSSSHCSPMPSSSSQPNFVYDLIENYGVGNIDDSSHITIINSYLNSPPIPRSKDVEFDVLSYWKDQSTIYPVLSRMARDVLAIPITSVASESCFSLAGRVISKYRSRLLPENAEVLVTTQNWLFGYAKDGVFEEDDDHISDHDDDHISDHDVDQDSPPN